MLFEFCGANSYSITAQQIQQDPMVQNKDLEIYTLTVFACDEDRKRNNEDVNYCNAMTSEFDKLCNSLGEPYCLYSGFIYSAQENKDKTINAFSHSCDQLNTSFGCLILGFLHYNEFKNKELGKKYIQKACDMKLPDACNALQNLK